MIEIVSFVEAGRNKTHVHSTHLSLCKPASIVRKMLKLYLSKRLFISGEIQLNWRPQETYPSIERNGRVSLTLSRSFSKISHQPTKVKKVNQFVITQLLQINNKVPFPNMNYLINSAELIPKIFTNRICETKEEQGSTH